jgi:hypothetical protein
MSIMIPSPTTSVAREATIAPDALVTLDGHRYITRRALRINPFPGFYEIISQNAEATHPVVFDVEAAVSRGWLAPA